MKNYLFIKHAEDGIFIRSTSAKNIKEARIIAQADNTFELVSTAQNGQPASARLKPAKA